MSHDPPSDDTHGAAFRDWDAAYLLGALTAADRRAYELHLRVCPACREALAEFVPLPGLLAHLPQEEALRLVDQSEESAEAAPAALLTRLAAATHSVRRRTRLRIAGLVLAAAGVSAAAALALPLAAGSSLPPVETTGATVSLAAAPGVPVEASVAFVPQQWGTRIDMDCSWAETAEQYAGSAGYVLYVTDTSGGTEAVGSWTSAPGTTMEPSLATGLPLSEIASVEVRLQGSDTVVLTGHP
ncbi:anti-sigma factor family protein [Rathayibacter rathayi]|uniref:anti-sigma factor family protein n=1 Tax=Rathayibacter rathayi TaxID=33887 RepID=UPI000CE8A9AC|nr:zf-HC2 domain-containing protein [Rathayibacter rathayi]PPF24021.1 anti-sigma factor [Rathayibacter rathayi]PPG90670.1 anti-sigma factor [Rathayibacter rathayi]PPG95045.1 anti-sigma factor [Rathayibacter rathayi]PPG98717.1 anti-sigma factor [Rathayibacter rathayi]